MNYKIIYKDDTEPDVVSAPDFDHIAIDHGFIHFIDEDDKMVGSFNLEYVDSVFPLMEVAV